MKNGHCRVSASYLTNDGFRLGNWVINRRLNYKEKATGKWFHSERGKRSAIISIIFSFFITVILLLTSEYLINFETLFPGLPAFISNGLFPLLILFFILWLYYKFIKKKFILSLNESVQALLVLILTSFTILTLIGIFFRGVDMALTFPWNL